MLIHRHWELLGFVFYTIQLTYVVGNQGELFLIEKLMEQFFCHTLFLNDAGDGILHGSIKML